MLYNLPRFDNENGWNIHIHIHQPDFSQWQILTTDIQALINVMEQSPS
jgi:hypothetical protein